MNRLQGKVAIVSGAAKGLGEADARLFGAEGAQIVIADVDTANGLRVAASIGPCARFVEHDVTSEAAWQSLVADVMRHEGKVDVLVNNAGVARVGTPESLTEADHRLVMAVSVDGTVFGCKHVIPAMKQSGGGSIINMSSIASIQGEPYVASYCAAKGAIEAYSRSVAVYCAQNRLGIRCNSIHPAAIETPMVASMGELVQKDSSVLALLETQQALKNAKGDPLDIAYLALYLASDESKFVSGQKFIVDNTSSVTSGYVPSST